VYNYLVNGESRSYWYAREHYSDFVFSSQGDGWYDTFRDRVGFVVTRPRDGTSPFHNQAKLHHNYGSASSTVDGLGHFRALWESNDGAGKVFAVVPGATVTGQGPPETELTLETTVTINGSGNQVAYRRRVSTGSDGSFSVVLAHPGEYEFVDRAGRVTVDESAVLDGADLTVEV
jgi:dolichyl-diphosphooligosaccharide--protein glycosyltransferase